MSCWRRGRSRFGCSILIRGACQRARLPIPRAQPTSTACAVVRVKPVRRMVDAENPRAARPMDNPAHSRTREPAAGIGSPARDHVGHHWPQERSPTPAASARHPPPGRPRAYRNELRSSRCTSLDAESSSQPARKRVVRRRHSQRLRTARHFCRAHRHPREGGHEVPRRRPLRATPPRSPIASSRCPGGSDELTRGARVGLAANGWTPPAHRQRSARSGS